MEKLQALSGADNMDKREAAAVSEALAMQFGKLSYNENLNARMNELEAEAREHGGQVAARSMDGLVTFCYADTHEQLDAILSEMKIDPSKVVFAYIQPLDVGEIF